MPIIPQGSINTAALVVPGLYIEIVPPQPAINGVPSNVIGVVGGASWGAVNTPTGFGSLAEYQQNFGNPANNNAFDMGTSVCIMLQQGASAFVGTRVTDGTDVKASVVVGTTNITYTALYSGTSGNNIEVTLSAGGATATWNATISRPGVLQEVFTNIGGTANAFWVNLANAINNGQGALRGPSQLISAVAGSGTTAATAGVVTLTGGMDGSSGLTAAMLVGTDTTTRAGMYTLRKLGVSILHLADLTDTTQFSVIDAFAKTEGMYAVQSLPAGETIAAAVTAVQAAGVTDSWLKVMHGDWLYWYDQFNAITRLVDPAAFTAGIIGALDPSQSSLNKPLVAVLGSQKAGYIGSNQLMTYSDADLQTLFVSGIDVITNPAPGGNYWAVRGGINSSLNAAVNGDNYTRMTNFIAATLLAGMGLFVGDKITATMDQEAVATIAGFMSNMQSAGLLGSTLQPPPWIVNGGLGAGTPNPQSRTALGYYQINVAVTYAPINRFFIVALQGGQTVVTSTPIVPSA